MFEVDVKNMMEERRGGTEGRRRGGGGGDQLGFGVLIEQLGAEVEEPKKCVSKKSILGLLFCLQMKFSPTFDLLSI